MGKISTPAHPASHITHLQGLCCHKGLHHKLCAWRHLHVHVCPSPQHLAGDELHPRLHGLQQRRAGQAAGAQDEAWLEQMESRSVATKTPTASIWKAFCSRLHPVGRSKHALHEDVLMCARPPTWA